MAQNPEEEIQEPVEGATQEPEVPMTQEQIDAVTMIQELQGDPNEPTMQEEVDADQAAAEAEGASIFGASEVEAARQLEAGEISPEGYASWQENKPEEQQMVAREEGKQTLREAYEEDLAETKFKPQARLNYTPTDSPNGYLERLMNNKEYSTRMFDDLGNARNVDGIIREIVADNQMAAFERGQEFDADRAHINMAGKLYIDIAHKLGMDVSGLDIESQDFRDFLRTSEAVLELQSGLALVRDGKRGKFKVMAGGVETKEDRWEKMASRGVFDGSGSPSEYRSGMSEEEWDEMGVLGKSLMWIPNTLQYTGHRLGKMGFPTFGMPTAPRFTTVGGEVVGAVAPFVVGVLGALRVGNAMGASTATQFMVAELAGAAADYAFTIEGEGNLANLLDEHGKLPQVLSWMKITEDDPGAAYKNIVEGGLAGGALALMLMTVKYGSKVAVGVARKFSPESLTDDMMAHLKKMDGGFYKSGADRIVEMHAGLDLGGMWRTIKSFKELGEMSASDTKTLRNLEENFAEKTKGMKAEEIDDIKTKVSADELPLDEKYGVDLIGEEEWGKLRGDQRSSVLEFKTGAFKDARRWNDSEKMIRDLNRKKKAGTITAQEKQSLVIAKRRQAIQRNKMSGSHGVNMNEWRQGEQEGSESLKSFLESKGVRVELTEDEIVKVRKLRSETEKLGGGVEDILKSVDVELRDSIRTKVFKGEELGEDESAALVEATGLHTDVEVKRLTKELDELKDGAKANKGKPFKLTASEEAEKVKLEQGVEKVELDIKEAEEALKTTETKKLRGLRTLYNRKVAVIGRWKAKVAKGNTLSETEKANKASFEIEVERIEKEIEKARKSYSKTDQAKLRKLDQKQKRKQKKLDELQEELDVATKGAKQVDIDAAQDELNKMLQVQRELAEEGGRSSGVALGRAQELINKARMLAEATDEATGELNDLRAAYGELSVAYKEYASYPKGKAPRPAEIELERAFYNVQKARVAEEDMLRGKRIEDTGANEQRSQAHKLTDQYPVPARSDNPTDVLKSEDWHRGNRNNGNWRAEDIGGLLSEFKDEGTGWGSKKAAESFTDFMDKHQYFRNGSVMRPAFSKYSMPVWLQGSRLLRVSSAVSGTGTSVLALGYGVAATLSRRGFRGLSRGLLSMVSREAREYHRLVKEVQAKQDAIVKAGRPSQRNFFQSVMTPSRRRADVTGSTGKEMEGAAYGMEGSELEHLGRSMDANSMTLLGVRAQNIENEYVRGFMTSLVGLWEVMPREAMGFIDDGIKLASFDQVLRESVVDTVWRAKRAKTADIDYMADMTNALRQLEEEVRGGKVAHNEVRTWLGERLGGDFSDEVDLAIKARDQAWEQQRELTLQQEVAGSMKMLQDVSQHPLGGHFFMFGKTTANTINMGLERTPILGYMFKHMRATTPMGKRDALAKQLVGAGIITAGGLTKKYASEYLIQDKYDNWHIKIPASKKDTLEQLENQFKQQPNLLSSMVASHNDWATSYQGKKQGARTYDLMVEGDREAYLDQYVGEHKGYTTYSMKRFGQGWSIFAGGIMAYDLVTGTANHLPKGKIDGEGGEIGLGEKLASWLTTFTDAYGLADAASGVDDLMRMIDNPEDIMTMIPFMISDSVTPWKGLLQSPSEPLGILLNTRDSRSPDWNAATFWERVLDRNWWGDDDSLPTKRNAVFRPVTRGSRLALLADEKTVADPFEAEMASVDLDISPVRPTSVAGLKDVDTYAYKNAEGQTAYDWITSRAAEIRLGADMDITRHVERYFGKQYVGEKKNVLKGLEELKKGSPAPEVIQAGVDSQQAIRKEVLKIRKEYLDRAVIEFKSEQLNNFTSDSGEKLSQSIDARETIRQEARSLRFDNLRDM